ncbi:MAG TPA: SMP-30/gluconolactonase/LRE family protein [Solirubrobacteraceae bacterium]|nr:SMP-30/gluconolactonase/LRE family protein [Solirubrobacteraceae bacterium]
MAFAVHTVMNGIMFGESPRWHENRLWFSDWGAQEVIAVDLAGNSEAILKVASFPFSIDWLADGRLLIVSASDRRLLRLEADGSLVTHADLAGLSGFPWNEIVVDGRDNAYVNNIGFDFSPDAQPGPGSLALVTADGSTRQVADDVAFPNGMVVTADNSTLILAESYANRLTAFDVAADGSLSNRRTWAALGDGVPDGICLDRDNAVWYADVPNKRCVRVREGGEVLQTIELDRGCFACMLGGPDNSTLFMVAREWSGPASAADGSRTGQVLSVEAPVPGAGWP